MAVAPLFVVDIDTLQSELRLTGLRSNSDGEQLFLRGTSTARVSLYQRLGLSVVAEMVALTEVENPGTAAEIRRKAASLVEIEIVRCELIEVMPVMLGDAAGDAQQAYNDEGVWRQIAPDERVELIGRCKNRIEELIELILDEDGLGNDLSIRVFAGGRPSDTRRFPAGTAFPGIGLFPGNFEDAYHFGNGEVPVRFELPDEDA